MDIEHFANHVPTKVRPNRLQTSQHGFEKYIARHPLNSPNSLRLYLIEDLLSFDEPAAEPVVEFWRAIACWEKPRYGVSGAPSRYLSGWIMTFSFFTAEVEGISFCEGRSGLVPHEIDGVEYFALDEKDKVARWVAVPIKLFSQRVP